jgi:hypothetical protein
MLASKRRTRNRKILSPKSGLARMRNTIIGYFVCVAAEASGVRRRIFGATPG